MKVRAWLALALILCLTVSLAACGSNDTAVYVQSVSNLSRFREWAALRPAIGSPAWSFPKT